MRAVDTNAKSFIIERAIEHFEYSIRMSSYVNRDKINLEEFNYDIELDEVLRSKLLMGAESPFQDAKWIKAASSAMVGMAFGMAHSALYEFFRNEIKSGQHLGNNLEYIKEIRDFNYAVRNCFVHEIGVPSLSVLKPGYRRKFNIEGIEVDLSDMRDADLRIETLGGLTLLHLIRDFALRLTQLGAADDTHHRF